MPRLEIQIGLHEHKEQVLPILDPSLSTRMLHDFLSRAREGDSAAWEQVFFWIEGRLKSIVLIKMRSRFADLERWLEGADVMNEARLRLFRYLREPANTPNNTEHFLGIVGKVTHRVLLDFVRRLKDGNGFARRYESFSDEPGRTAKPMIESVADEVAPSEYADVLDAIEQLPDQLKEVVTMRYVLGMKNDEVADALGISTGSASEKLREGRERIQRLFE